MRAIIDLPADRVEPIIGKENMARWNDEMLQGRQMLEQLEARAKEE